MFFFFLDFLSSSPDESSEVEPEEAEESDPDEPDSLFLDFGLVLVGSFSDG